ncbi:hypothetical protein T492DRAFT_1142813 [Pavlovales sp. CCMP2436]|nr:hypothetical protein T492DRAFT_1142813 [Pavlovales sp. CCMP2436]
MIDKLLDKLQVLPLTRQLTTIAGNLWSHSLKGQRAERIEFLLLHEFNRLGYVVPDKLSQKEREATVKRRGKNAAAAQRLADGDGDDYGDEDDAPAEGAEAGGNGRKKPAYAGGLVLEPKRGLYDHYVLLLDFNSLYPSIVQEYNLCFTTVEIPVPLPDGTVPPPMLPEQGFSAPGVLPVLIKGIVDRRRDVKKLLAKMMLLLKKKKYAALVVEGEENGVATKWSRETKGLDLVRRDWCLLSRDVGSKVLDLLLSARPRDEIVEAVHEYLRAVAAAVRANQLPIEQYAISKGLTKSPADYPDARNQAHVQVALQLLARGEAVAPGSVIEYVVCEYKPDAAAGATSTAQGQADGDGASIGTPPAAKREPKPSVAPVGKSIAERARHPSAVLAADGALSVDREWYLANQIHPPVARLLDVIEGTDSARIAECLGLDPSKFSGGQSGAVAAEGVDEIFGNAVEDDEARFRDVSPLTLACAACGESAHARPLTSAVPAVDGKHPALACAACGEPYDGVLLHNQLTVAMRRAEKTYYTVRPLLFGAGVRGGFVRRSEPLPLRLYLDGRERPTSLPSARPPASPALAQHCPRPRPRPPDNTHSLASPPPPAAAQACVAPRCRAHMVARHTARELHTQLLYLERLFDCAYAQRRAERAHRRQPESQPTWTPMCKADKEFCEELVAHVRSRLADCAYHSVNVGKLCALVRGSVPSQATLGIAPVV